MWILLPGTMLARKLRIWKKKKSSFWHYHLTDVKRQATFAINSSNCHRSIAATDFLPRTWSRPIQISYSIRFLFPFSWFVYFVYFNHWSGSRSSYPFCVINVGMSFVSIMCVSHRFSSTRPPVRQLLVPYRFYNNAFAHNSHFIYCVFFRHNGNGCATRPKTIRIQRNELVLELGLGSPIFVLYFKSAFVVE